MSKRNALALFFGAGSSRAVGIPTMVEMVTNFAESTGFSEYHDFVERCHQELTAGLSQPGLWASPSKRILVEDDANFLGHEAEKKLRSQGILPAYWVWRYANEIPSGEIADIETILRRLPDVTSFMPQYAAGAQAWMAYHQVFGEAPVGGDEGVPRQLNDRLKATAESLRHRILEFIKKSCCPELDRRTLRKVLSPLFEAVRATALAYDIVTTNYDVVIETFLDNSRIGYKDGTDRKGVFDCGLLDRRSKVPRVIKLHGSIDLYRTATGFRKIPVPNVTVLADGTSVSELMIYPVPDKDLRSSPFGDLLTVFRSILESACGCIVVGYGLRDGHILEAFKKAYQNNPAFRVGVINPDADSLIRSRLGFMKENVVGRSGKLEDLGRGDLDHLCAWVRGDRSA